MAARRLPERLQEQWRQLVRRTWELPGRQSSRIPVPGSGLPVPGRLVWLRRPRPLLLPRMSGASPCLRRRSCEACWGLRLAWFLSRHPQASHRHDECRGVGAAAAALHLLLGRLHSDPPVVACLSPRTLGKLLCSLRSERKSTGCLRDVRSGPQGRCSRSSVCISVSLAQQTINEDCPGTSSRSYGVPQRLQHGLCNSPIALSHHYLYAFGQNRQLHGPHHRGGDLQTQYSVHGRITIGRSDCRTDSG